MPAAGSTILQYFTSFDKKFIIVLGNLKVRKGLFFIERNDNMVEKLRLKDGTEFELIPMPIEDKGKLRIIKFISELPHAEILAKFSKANIEKMEYILADETIGTTYEDCTAFKSLTFVPNVQIDDNTVSDIYVVAISTDAVERGMQILREEMESVANTVIMMFMPMM